jgi:hypothetical protein
VCAHRCIPIDPEVIAIIQHLTQPVEHGRFDRVSIDHAEVCAKISKALDEIVRKK